MEQNVSEQTISENNISEKKNRHITGATLKYIAIITMLIDHIGAALIEPGLSDSMANFPLVMLDFVLRAIGRLAFPIFIFLLIEGFTYTHSRIRYALNLLLFAFISEIPFDMAFHGFTPTLMKPFECSEGQNVFFTLFLGLVAIMLIDRITIKNTAMKIENGVGDYSAGHASPLVNKNVLGFLRGIGVAGVTVLFATIAYYMKTDYDAYGVIAIIMAYIFRKSYSGRMLFTVIALAVSNPFEICAALNMVFIGKYDGTRGKLIGGKWLFYLFYPVHILILGLIRMAIY